MQKKLRLKQQLESKREKRDKRWLKERVKEVERELEDCCDKAQTHASEIEMIEMRLEPLEFTKNEKKGQSASQTARNIYNCYLCSLVPCPFSTFQ